jgi:uncharacterized membrane protein
MNKILKLAFLGSIILNVLMLGIFLGELPRRFVGNSSRQQRMEQALKDLPTPVQTRFREKFQQIRAAGDPLRDQMGRARAEAIRILSVEPFDEAAYDRQVSQIDELRMQMFKRMGQVVKGVAKELPPEERRMFAEMLKRPPPAPDR